MHDEQLMLAAELGYDQCKLGVVVVAQRLDHESWEQESQRGGVNNVCVAGAGSGTWW